MRHRLTDSTARKLDAPEKGNRIYYDTLVDGFGLRVTANGARSFILNYRTKAARLERRYTIGDIEHWSAVKARDHARALKQGIDAGKDPLDLLEKERAAPTVAELATRYVDEHLPRKRKRSQIEDLRLLPIILDGLGRKKVAAISYTDVDTLHRTVTKDRGPFRANRVLALLSKMCALAIRWKYRPDNPCIGVERNYEPKRNRYLTKDELPRLVAALDADHDQQGVDIIRLLLLTGARSAEVLNATWDQFDLENGVWTKPHTATKQEEEHRLPLADEAVELLKRLRADAAPKARYVFPSADSPFKPRATVRHTWDRIRKVTGLEDVRPHDLRHSHASFLVNAGFSLPVIGAVLGHKTPSTTARYAHLADETLRAAVKSVGSKVVPIKGRA